jgi:hypothetical protein
VQRAVIRGDFAAMKIFAESEQGVGRGLAIRVQLHHGASSETTAIVLSFAQDKLGFWPLKHSHRDAPAVVRLP